MLRHVRIGDVQGALYHPCHLFFGSRTRPSDGLLDPTRGIFGHRHLSGQGRREGNALGTAKLEHGLHIFAKKRRLYRKMIRRMGLN